MDQVYTLGYILPAVLSSLPPPPASIFEIGCGNGSWAKVLMDHGYSVSGIDPSESDIEMARQRGTFECRSVYDDLSSFAPVDIVLSIEVIEHLTNPRGFVSAVRGLLKPNGIAIISTPYHGYIKNFGLSLFNKWDSHLDPLSEGGHIKLWSRNTLQKLFAEFGMSERRFLTAGRIGPLAKSMVVTYALD